jgi:hypothetical protein
MEQLTEPERRYLVALIEFEIERIEQHEIGQPYYLTDLAIATALKSKLSEQ